MKETMFHKLAAIGSSFSIIGLVVACGDNDEEYPSDDIDFITPFGTGGSTDPIAREFTRLWGEEMDVQFIVENLPGGDQVIGTSQMLGADPDGYTLGLATPAGLLVQPAINDDVPYDGLDDVEPIAKLVSAPNAIFVADDSEFETFDDFVDAARDNPNELRVGVSAGYADSVLSHFLIEDDAGIETTVVPFSEGAGEAVLALQSGNIDAVTVTASGQMGLVEAGELRPLAHTGSSDYDDFLPGAVALEDHGFDDLLNAEYMVVGPPGMPDDVVERLTDTAETVATSDEFLDWTHDQAFLPDVLIGQEVSDFLSERESVNERALEVLESRNGHE